MLEPNDPSVNHAQSGVTDTTPHTSRRTDAVSPRQRLKSTSVPVVHSAHGTLRPLEYDDAFSLASSLGTAKVREFLPTVPNTVEAFSRYIRWAARQQRIGRHLAFGVVPRGQQSAVGLFQIWPIDSQLWTAEIGFALGQSYWGTGLFLESAEHVVGFAMDTLGIYRLEARSAMDNARGNRALEKLGAHREGLLRQCFECEGQLRDHVMWAIVREDWNRRHADRRGDSQHVSITAGSASPGIRSVQGRGRHGLNGSAPTMRPHDSHYALRPVK